MICIVAPLTNKPGNDRLSCNGHDKTDEQVLKYLDSVHLIALSIVPSGKVGEARQLRTRRDERALAENVRLLAQSSNDIAPSGCAKDQKKT